MWHGPWKGDEGSARQADEPTIDVARSEGRVEGVPGAVDWPASGPSALGGLQRVQRILCLALASIARVMELTGSVWLVPRCAGWVRIMSA